MRLGISESWHVGNGKAEGLAKLAARQRDLPQDLLHQHRDHGQLAERVAATVAAIQVRRLQKERRSRSGNG